MIYIKELKLFTIKAHNNTLHWNFMDKLYKLIIEKDGLNSIEATERSFFFALGHVANEINMLSKQVVWCSDFSSESDHIVKGQITLSLFSYRTLAGKLNEGNELIRNAFLSKKFAKSYVNSFNEEANEALNKIKRYFGSTNIVNKIRNNHSFHYSADNFNNNMDDLPDDLEIYLHKTQGNSLYYASEVLASSAMIKSCGKSDFSKLFDEIVSELIHVSKLILSFSHQFMRAFMDKHSKILVKEDLEEIDLGEVPLFSEVQMPWFVAINNDK